MKNFLFFIKIFKNTAKSRTNNIPPHLLQFTKTPCYPAPPAKNLKIRAKNLFLASPTGRGGSPPARRRGLNPLKHQSQSDPQPVGAIINSPLFLCNLSENSVILSAAKDLITLNPPAPVLLSNEKTARNPGGCYAGE